MKSLTSIYVTTQELHGIMWLPKKNPLQEEKNIGSHKKAKKKQFVKKKLQFPKKSGKCFICGKKGHYVKWCKLKKIAPLKLLQVIEDMNCHNEYYTWFNMPTQVSFAAIDLQSQESDATMNRMIPNHLQKMNKSLYFLKNSMLIL